MVLVNRVRLVTYIILIFIFSVTFASYSYYVIFHANNFSSAQLKLHAENLFFIGIVGAVTLGIFGILIIRKSYKLGKALDKMLVLVRNTGHSPDSGLRKLGKTGIQIADILAELDKTGVMKTFKISSMDNLIKVIMKNYKEPLFIVSEADIIIYCSAGFNEKYSLAPEQLSGTLLEDFIKDKNVADAFARVKAEKKEEIIGKARLVPVSNNAGSISYIIGIYEPGAKINAITENIQKVNNIQDAKLSMKKAFDFFKTRK